MGTSVSSKNSCFANTEPIDPGPVLIFQTYHIDVFHAKKIFWEGPSWIGAGAPAASVAHLDTARHSSRLGAPRAPEIAYTDTLQHL